ncbi:hypothetical protein [Terribacillus saccharophilus]|nr:hypothetical protein [Terribacillus saccharophilus]
MPTSSNVPCAVAEQEANDKQKRIMQLVGAGELREVTHYQNVLNLF